MITWYEDDILKIEFDKIPDVGISYPMPFYGKKKNRDICLYPFINKQPLTVNITWKNDNVLNVEDVYNFSISKGYCWDGASIPRFAWRVIGSNTEPEFIIASMLHDTLCEHHSYVKNNRYLSTIVFERCLKVAGVGSFKRWVMKHSVDNSQKLAGKWR